MGCSAFSSLIFKWPIGRVIFSAFAGSLSILLLSLRKLDKLENQAEEASLIGCDLFVSGTFAIGTYLWFVAVTSIPLALGHRAMTMKLITPPKKPVTKVATDATDEKNQSTNVIDISEDDLNETHEEETITDDAILRRLGMRSKHSEKNKCLQTLRRNYLTAELRKFEALQDIKAPMKPSDRHGCSHSLYRKTWKIQSFLYLIVLTVSSIPSVFSIFFEGRPSPVFWSLGIRGMHGGFAVVLVR